MRLPPIGALTGFDPKATEAGVRSWDSAQAAPSPRCAAGGREVTEPEGIDPAATAPAAPAPAATSASDEPAVAATTAAAAGKVYGATNVFSIEEMERGEIYVLHFLFAKDEALIG